MIEFAGRTLESFENVKVKRVADGFQSDFETQTVVDGGAVPASISVPSVRVFDVDFLVRGNTHEEIQEKIIEIADFVKDAGVDKLYTRRSRETYHLARCTSFGYPVFPPGRHHKRRICA